MFFLSFWKLMLQGKHIKKYIYVFYVYRIFLHSSLILEKNADGGGGSNWSISYIYIYTIWTHIFVYWIFIHSSLILEKTLVVGGVLTERFRIYIYTIWWVFSILMVPRHKFHFEIHLFFKFQFKKVLKHWFFQLLARSWFWWLLFSIQNSI